MSSKIKDGLFMGDMDAAQDADFLQLNGIVHIINCVPRRVPNIFQQSLGLSYTPCDLDEVLRRPFFDLKNREFMHLIQLIDRALERTESVLVHSLNGINRSPSVMVAYLMVKYCWGLDKAHEFVVTKRADMKLHESYIDQLCSLEAQIQQDCPGRATERQLYEWSTHVADLKSDELVLIHTFLNSSASNEASLIGERQRKLPQMRRLTWIDQTEDLKKLHPLLQSRPERPPNNSYNKMVAANGWMDLVDPSPASHQVKAKTPATDAGITATRVAFADMSVSNAKLEAMLGGGSGPRARSVESGDMPVGVTASSARQPPHETTNKRLHSFSAPKRTEIVDDDSSPSTTSTSDRDELEFMPDVVSSSSHPRYLRQTMASSNARPRRLSTSGPAAVYRAPPVSSKHVPLQGSGRSSSAGLGLTGSSVSKVVPKASKMPPKRSGKTGSVPSAVASRPTSTTAEGRVFYNVDFPPPSSKPSVSSRSRNGQTVGGSVRRSANDPLVEQQQSGACSRPRTAPPRGRKNLETRELLQSKKVDVAGFSRVSIEPQAQVASRRMHSSLDYGLSAADVAPLGNTSTSGSVARGGRRSSLPSATGYRRARTPRASWK